MIRRRKQIEKYLQEANDRVWFMRSDVRPETTSIPDDIKERALEEQERIEAEYDWSDYSWINENGETYLFMDDTDYHRWEGIMATLRWVLGDEEKDNYDT